MNLTSNCIVKRAVGCIHLCFLLMGSSFSFAYGQECPVQTANPQQLLYCYDALGRLTEVISKDNCIRYSYDQNGNRISVIISDCSDQSPGGQQDPDENPDEFAVFPAGNAWMMLPITNN